jgi:hypothetical protein
LRKVLVEQSIGWKFLWFLASFAVTSFWYVGHMLVIWTVAFALHFQQECDREKYSGFVRILWTMTVPRSMSKGRLRGIRLATRS